MKKSLLLFLLISLPVLLFAQRTMPVPATVSQVEFNKYNDLGKDSVIYYLYNTSVGAFYTEGNEYGTRASVSAYGIKVSISQYRAKDASGLDLPWDGKSVIINNYSVAKSRWDQLFVDSKCIPYVDCANRGNNIWNLDAVGDGTYTISLSDLNPIYSTVEDFQKSQCFFGLSHAAVSSNLTGLTANNSVIYDPYSKLGWAFVTEFEYDKYAYDYSCYVASQNLAAVIENARNVGDIDLTAAEAVYYNSASTLKALKDATAAINQAIVDKLYTSASDETPYDITHMIVNPDFSAKNANGWDTTYEFPKDASFIGYQSAGSNGFVNGDVKVEHFFQVWSNGVNYQPSRIKGVLAIGQFYQTIKNLPSGKYKLCADCIATNQYEKSANPVYGVELFAQGGSLTTKTNVATDSNLPKHYEFMFANDGNEVTIGLRTLEGTTASWIAATNFKLYYLGSDYTAIEEVSADMNAKATSIYTISGARVNNLKKGINIIRKADGSVSKMYVK